MKRVRIFSQIALFILILSSVLTAQDQKGSIKLEIEGFESDDGMARILVFSSDQKDAFPSNQGKAMFKKIVPIMDKKVTYEVIGLPYGDYAISVHHDANNDGKVNTNWIGIPNEGLGSSNDAKGFMGPPSFNKAKVTLDKSQITCKINMVN